jgi:type II secretory pathway component PulM
VLQNDARSSPRISRSLIAVLVIVWCVFIVFADRARERLNANIKTLRAESVQVERWAAEIVKLRASSKPVASGRDARALIEADARAAGFAQAMRIDAIDAAEARVTFSRVSFVDWLAWLERLQANQLRVKASRVEMLGTDGFVTATATLSIAPHP